MTPTPAHNENHTLLQRGFTFLELLIVILIISLLFGLGANEVYTNSLVAQKMAGKNSLKIANPLGIDSSALRTSLRPSLADAASVNKNVDSFHIFEMANIYLPQNGLPQENMMLAGIIKGQAVRKAKGVVEALLGRLRVSEPHTVSESKHFVANKHLDVGGVGGYGELTSGGLFYYEFNVEKLRTAQTGLKYTPIPKFPAQIEDITLKVPEQVYISEVIDSLLQVDKRVSGIDYVGKYKNYHTLRIYYQDPTKTLANKDVEKLRHKIVKRAEAMNLRVKE